MFKYLSVAKVEIVEEELKVTGVIYFSKAFHKIGRSKSFIKNQVENLIN